MVTMRPPDELVAVAETVLLRDAAADFLAGFLVLTVAFFFAGDAAVFLPPAAVEDRVVLAMMVIRGYCTTY